MDEQKINEVNSLVRAKSRNELVLLCKEKKLSFTGTKHDMAVRLIGGWTNGNDIRLQPCNETITIKKNKNGQWQFENIVFDEKTKNAIGYLDENDQIQSLQRKHIEICKKFKFRYIIPDILDERKDIVKKVIIDDSSDDDDDYDEDDNVDEDAPSF
jgi:hypothetical protein